ncbi:phthioceranic/hydroxyphthioceranic acid synthase-like [Pelobates fuscus]|uniref:phthioceranic/hydroxyphthioceranic acid synthase-like n=1 Tax=Pelobates fuscus TaxID=191477 RepID=UPI002FE43FF3
MDDTEDYIAIVGIGCNFPGGEGIDNFWQVIVEGRNCAVDIPSERFDVKKWYDPDYNKPGKSWTCRAALIEGLDEFDNKLFGISNSETENMDPQHKLLLESTFRALEDAGYPMESVSGSNTGVFIGLMNRDSESIFNAYESSINHFNGTGTASSIAANRVSYCFNLNGPSMVIDTACSSSLTALHYACQAIKQGDCEMAVCGGVSCILEPRIFVALTKAKMISPDGISKPFSKMADGYGRGEGAGIVLLKKLNKAKQDGSKVWGVICASAVNQDGRSMTPITKPSQRQQEALLKTIYSIIDPSTVQYVEAHGTGTPVGDPVEAASIGNIIGKNCYSGSPLKIGSVKGNIGHTESASGVAGLIKVLLMMHHEVIPPSLHYSKDLGIIQIEEANLTIPITPEKWRADSKFGRVASINSFGFGGTNVHVVLKQHKQNCSKCLSKRPVEMFVVSAASSKSLQLTIEDTKQQLNKVDSLSFENLVYTSVCRRSHRNFKFRKAFLASSLKHLQEQLAKANTESFPAQRSPELVFVFCGNGLLYKGMCKMLLRSEPVFRKKCIEIDELLQVCTSLSMVKLLESEFDDFSRPDIAQLLLFTIQTSLVALLRHWGVKPDTIVGHSVGEVAAAHCSGLLSLQDAVKVIYYRSTLQSKVTGGTMLVVSNIPVTEISKDIRSYGQRINMAAYNSPTSCTVSGNAESIVKLHDQLNQQYSKRNIFLYKLDVPAAYHSHLMDPILEEIKDKLQDLTPHKLEIDLISTVTGEKATNGDFTTGDYWARNIREPVLFDKAIRSSIKHNENAVFIEIGPRRGLERNIKEIVGQTSNVLPAIQLDKEYEIIFSILVKLFTEGYNPDWCNIYETYKSPPAAIPRYQFDHVKKYINFEKIHQGNQSFAKWSHSLIHSMNEDFTEFRCTVSKEHTPYIYEHKNNEMVLVPGSFYVELALTATISSLKPKVPLSSLSVYIHFNRPCIVNQETLNLTIKLEEMNKVTHFEILSSHLYASGKIERNFISVEEKKISFQHILKRCNLVLKQDEVYESLSLFGFQYGKAFRQLSDIHYGGELKEGLARVTVTEEIEETMYENYIHPVVLDSFFQMSVIAGTQDKEPTVLFPSEVGSLTILRPLQKVMYIHLKTIKKAKKYFVVCGCFSDENGFILVEIKHSKITFLKQSKNELRNIFFQNKWVQVPEEMNKPTLTPKTLVFADSIGIGHQLAEFTDDGLEFVHFNSWDLHEQLTKKIKSKYKEILFMWGIHTPSESSQNLTHYLAKCCETYRQVILAVKQLIPGASIRTVTFRTAGTTVDHINPGFALIGMTRSCIIEMSDITFQLIDISSSNREDVKTLAHVVHNFSPKNYPEIWINKGQIFTNEVARTEMDIGEQRVHTVPLKKSDSFILLTENPYRVTELSAELNNSSDIKLTETCVEVQIDLICSHTEDFFPVTTSSFEFGNTLYWSHLSKEKHNLIALDFTGTVTKVGKGVKKLKVGDRIASCYPTAASSRTSLPESVCYLIKKIPVLRKLPCVSLFILAWEIFHRQLPPAKNKPKLIIISSAKTSILNMILINTAKRRGWDPKVSSEIDINAKQCSAMIILHSSTNILMEDLSQLPLLKDLVLIRFQALNEHCRQDIHICLLNPVTILQRGYICRFSKDIYKWLQSIHEDISLNLSTSTHASINCIDDTGFSYFTAHSLPLLDLDKNISSISLIAKQETLFKRGAIYIVTGGLTGLGFETVKFILRNGGGNIVILSRRNPTPEMRQDIKKAKGDQKNVIITTISCDISSYSEVTKTMHTIQKIFPNIPIKGVFHSAVVLHDGVLQHLDISLFEKVLKPKVDGAINLHRATINQELDYFVCYSSVASFVGNAAQANYAAANSFLDIFCQYRRNMGLSGQSINWGALNLGLLNKRNHVQEMLEAKGLILFNTEEMHKHLKKCLKLNNSQQAIIKFDVQIMHDNLLSYVPTLKKRIYNAIREEVSTTKDTIRANVSSKHTNMKSEDYVMAVISELTSLSLSDIIMDSFLNSLGIDSMLGMTLQNRILQEKNVLIPIVKLLDPSTTISSIVSILNENTNNSLEETKF